jgi:hypothetical protein
LAKPALEAGLVEEMTARSFANFVAWVDIVETDRTRTDLLTFHAKRIEVDNCAAIQRPLLWKYGALGSREEITDAVHGLPKLKQAPIEDVDFPRIRDKR